MSFSRAHGLPPNGGRHVFDSVRPLLTSGDYTTGNLEGNLGRGGPSKCKGNCHAFQAPPSYAHVFRKAGFRMLNMANNHSRDFGVSGIKQAVSALKKAGVKQTGLNGQTTLVTVRGVKVAFLGFAPYAYTGPLLNIGAARKQVARAAKRADVVIVFIHAGAEGAGATHTPHGTEHAFGENRGAPRKFSHAVIDAGADAVLGSGPHVLRGIECYKRGIVAYSLGNFSGYNTLSTSGVLALSGVLRVRIDEDGRFRGGRLFPVRIAHPGIPRRDPSRASVKLVRSLSKSDFGKRACPISKSGVIKPR
jgi:poly-gamma-glutamate capsule biosynthesis protein CapA/YwtB (metallophosphatase superfamily)